MIIPLIGAILLAYVSILYLLLALGKPLGFLAWGGRHPGSLPKNLRIQSAVSIPSQLFAAYLLLALGDVISVETGTLLVVFGYIFMVFFLINSIMNALSVSFYEKYIMTPIALWIFFCFIYVLFL